MTFQEQIQQGIPTILPLPKPFDTEINHAPKRKEILSPEEQAASDRAQARLAHEEAIGELYASQFAFD